MRLLTANLLYRSQRVGPFLECVSTEEPDLLLLQELTPAVADRLSTALAATYAYALLEPHDGADGFGVFARWPLAVVADGGSEGDVGAFAGGWQRASEVGHRVATSSADDSELLARGNRFVQRCRMAGPWGPVDLFNSHLVSPVDADAMTAVGVGGVGRLRMAQAAAIARSVEGEADAIVAGDFNAWPGRPAVRIIGEVARDAWEAGVGAGATWPRRLPWLDLPAPPVFRLDYCFVTGRLAASRAHVYRASTGSDHCPVVVDLDIAAVVEESVPPLSSTSA